jgi:hypothetical protein
MNHKENSTPYDVCISQLPLWSIALLCSHQEASEGGYITGLHAEYQASFRLGSDKVFKCQQAFQWTPYCYNSHVVNTGSPPSLISSGVYISKKYFRPGGMAPSEWTRSVRAVRDTPVADYSAPGVNSTRRFPYRPLIAVSPFLLVLSVSYFKRSLWRCG